ncbi:MAG: transposase [Anaerolineales bacterium]|nr:transposase [Anaerolineales bacterium]
MGPLLGLTNIPYQSGESAREPGISNTAIANVRTSSIESACRWIRYKSMSEISR